MSDQNIPVTANGSVQIDCDNDNNSSSQSIVFSHDNGTELMRIQENGNVGIGTTSPQYNLHVEGVGTRIVNKGTSASTYATINLMNNDDDGFELVAYGRSATGYYFGLERGGGLFLGAGPQEVLGMGTKNETPLVLATDGAERMRITEDGKIGIGTTDPDAAVIDISKNITAVEQITNCMTVAPTMNTHDDSDQLITISVTPEFNDNYSNTTKQCLLIAPSGDLDAIQGINVFLPDPTMTANSAGIFVHVDGLAYGINVESAYGETGGIGVCATGYVGGKFQGTNAALQTVHGNVTIMDGNVGIGTTSPAEKLVVAQGSDTYQEVLRLHNMRNPAAGTHGVGIGFQLSADYEDYKKAEIRAIATDNYANDIALTFWSGGSSAADHQERMRIMHDGNVGIGTTSPASKLHVDAVLRLEPQSSAPSGGKGDMYVDTSGNLYVHNGTNWAQVAFA